MWYVHKNTTFQNPHTPDKKLPSPKKNAVENICTRKKQKNSRLPENFCFFQISRPFQLPFFTTPVSKREHFKLHLGDHSSNFGSRESISNCTPRTCTFGWRWRTMMHSATNTRVKGHGKLIEKNQKVTAQVTGRICRSQKIIMLADRSTYTLAQLGNELFEASMWDDCVKVSTLLSSQSAQSFINYQNSRTHLQITEMLMEARASLDLEHKNK